jgi:glutamate-5-semialdehyde dehydrogenase
MTEQTDSQSYLEAKGQAAVAASRQLALSSSELRNQALRAMAAALESRAAEILAANAADLEAATAAGTSVAMLDRLRLDEQRIAEMAKGLREVAALADPLGEVLRGWRMPNGLEIRKIRVPLGVIGIIYEARPNVTVDAAALCLKTANACLLRGGSEAIRSNQALAAILSTAAAEAGLPAASVQLVERTDRETAKAMMRLNQYLDVLIPRGGAGLIQTVVREATVPVIETGGGQLPCVRRCLGRFGDGGADHREWQDPASGRLQCPRNRPGP